MAMEQKGSGKRHATLIAAEECYIGAIDIDNYYSLLHSLIENSHHKFIHFISTFFIFQNLSLNVWEKRYITLFINRIYEKDFLLLKEGETIDQIYFTYKGEFEITTNRNLIGVNELIIHYKKTMLKLLSKIKNNSKKMKKECDIRVEMKENDNFIMNKKFHGEQFEKMIFDKKIIKLGLYSSREIIGLLDLYSNIKNNDNSNKEEDTFRIRKLEMISLFNCKCVSCNCEVYSFSLNKFKDMFYTEDKVEEFTIELEIQKIKYMIKRLKQYKEFLYENLYKKEKENIEEIKTINNKNMRKGLKNKFEPFKEYSNISLKNGIINNNIFMQKYINKNNYKKKLFNSCVHLSNFNESYDKNIGKSQKLRSLAQTTYNYNKKKDAIKIKQKLLPLPVIDNTDTNIKIKSDINDKPRFSTEKKDNNCPKPNILLPKNDENDSLHSKNIIFENYKNSVPRKKSIATNTYIDPHKLKTYININKDLMMNRQIFKKQNWVSKILMKNLVYNHIFDKYVFTSNMKDYKKNFNSTQYNSNKILSKPKDLSFNEVTVNNSKNEKKLCKSIDKNCSNKTEINLFFINGNNFFSKKSKNDIKAVKLKTLKIKKKEKYNSLNNTIKNKNKNKIYDALIVDNFNKYFYNNIGNFLNSYK